MTEPGQQIGSSREAADVLSEDLWGYALPLAEDRPPDETPTGLVDLGFIGSALRRSKRVWATLAVVGLLFGAGLFVHTKPSYQATTNVILANDPAQDAVTSVQTATQIAEEPAVGKLALQELGLPGNKLPYSVFEIDPQVLAFSLSAPTAADAASQSQAVASAFLQIRSQEIQTLLTASVTAQAKQLAQLQNTVQTLSARINQLNAGQGSVTESRQLAAFEAQLSGAQNALSTLVGQQATARVTAGNMTSGSKILSTSTPVPSHSSKRLMAEYIGGGLFCGLAVGLGIVVVGAVLSSRLYRRDDVAAALSAPVRLSVLSGGKRKRTWIPGTGRAGARQRDVARVADYLRGRVTGSADEPGCLAVIALDDTGFAAEAVTKLVGLCTQDGKRVAVADLAGGTLARQLGMNEPGLEKIAAAEGQVAVVLPDPGEVAPIGPRGPRGSKGELATMYAACDIMVTLVVLDPAVGADHLATWAGVSVAVVTAGESSVLHAQAIGEMVREAGGQLAAGVLLGADKRDESLGLIPV